MEPSGALAAAPLAPPLALDGQEKSKVNMDPQETPSGDPKENEEATLDVLTEKVDTLEKEADTLEEEVYVLQRGATLQGKVKNLQEKQGVLDTNLQEKEDALQDGATQEKVEDLKGDRGVLANVDPVPHSGNPEGMEAIVDVQQEKADALQKKLDAMRKEYDALPKDLDAMLKEFDDVRKVFDAPRNKLDALRKELDSLQGVATRQKAKDLQSKQGVLTTLNPPVSPSGDQEEEARVTLDALWENMHTLQKELNAGRKEFDVLLKVHNVMVKENNALRKKLTALRKEFDALRKELNALLKKLYALQKEVNVLRKELDALQRGANQEKAKDLQGKQGVQAMIDPPVPPSGDQEEEEEEEGEETVTFEELQEIVDNLQKEVDALQGGGDTTQEKVEALQKDWEVQKDELGDFILGIIWVLELEAEALWNAWFQNDFRKIFLEDQGLSQENVNSLKYYLLKFLQNMSNVKKVDELHDALQEEQSAPCHGQENALWEKVKELDFALWDINLYAMDELQEVVDACLNALREGPQEEVGALQKKLEAMQDILRAIPLKKLSALREITSDLLDAIVGFPRDAPAKEKQDALWDDLQDVPLKEMCDMWRKVKTLWGFPLKMFAVWEKVYTLNILLQAGSRNRVCNLQENLKPLKDALRDALREEMGIHQDKLTALWTSVQDLPLNELGVLEDKLNALGKRLWNIPKEKLFLPKETVDASQKVLDSPHSVSQGELSEIPEEEVDALQRTPAEEEITEADKSDSLPAWKTPDTGPGFISVTQQGDLSKMKEEINLNVEQEISLISSQPDDLGRSKGKKETRDRRADM